jgi:hypothetical protein
VSVRPTAPPSAVGIVVENNPSIPVAIEATPSWTAHASLLEDQSAPSDR